VTFAQPPRDLAKRLKALGLTVERIDGAQALLAASAGTADADLLSALVGAGLKVSAFQAARRTLEDAYLAETGR
jgi:hypothetical protein